MEYYISKELMILQDFIKYPNFIQGKVSFETGESLFLEQWLFYFFSQANNWDKLF